MTDLLDLVPDAVIRLDGDRRILAVNRAALALTGYERDELEGADAVERLDPRDREGRPVWPNGWPRAARLRSVHSLPEQEVVLRRADTNVVRTYITGVYERDDDGRITGLVLSVRESGKRTHKLTSGIEIVSTVSHELRSPLTSVKGYTSLLLSRWDRIGDEQKKEMLEQVKHDADRVHRLITELLDISRLETGRLVLRRQLIDLTELAATVLEKVRFTYPDLDANVDFAEGFPRVYADPDKMEQVLTNLVENASKYASPQGMKIIGRIEDDYATVSVIDRGEGIPADDLPKVFTKFFRREMGRPTGSGLGLWISRGLVEAHSGELTASSVPGEGTTFRFTLPLGSFEEIHG